MSNHKPMSLDLDETDERRFRHSCEGYGAEVTDGTAEQRKEALLERIDEPVVEIDGREIGSTEEFSEAMPNAEANITILEFDSMDSEIQTSVAQRMKGVAEAMNSDRMIGYTAEEGGAVVRAEFDLSARIRTWGLEESTDE